MSEPSDGTLLVLNPQDDDSFSALAARLLAQGVTDPGRMQALLRDRYPEAVVRRRELVGERSEIWYVYRDGHWIRPAGTDRPD